MPFALALYDSIVPPVLDVISPIIPCRGCYVIGPLHRAANSFIFVSRSVRRRPVAFRAGENDRRTRGLP